MNVIATTCAGFNNWRRNASEAIDLTLQPLRDSLPEDFAEQSAQYQVRTVFRVAARQFTQLKTAQKIGMVAKTVFVAGGIYLSTRTPASQSHLSGAGLFATQAIGFVAYGVSLCVPRLDNRHRLALIPLFALPLSLHKHLMGADAYATMALSAGLRAFILSCVPEDKRAARFGIAIKLTKFGGWSTVGTIAARTTWWNAMPLLSMTLGMIADTVKSDKSRYTRILSVVANANNSIYSFFFSRSIPGCMLDITNVYNNAKAISTRDFPKKDAAALECDRKAAFYLYRQIIKDDIKGGVKKIERRTSAILDMPVTTALEGIGRNLNQPHWRPRPS